MVQRQYCFWFFLLFSYERGRCLPDEELWTAQVLQYFIFITINTGLWKQMIRTNNSVILLLTNLTVETQHNQHSKEDDRPCRSTGHVVHSCWVGYESESRSYRIWKSTISITYLPFFSCATAETSKAYFQILLKFYYSEWCVCKPLI